MASLKQVTGFGAGWDPPAIIGDTPNPLSFTFLLGGQILTTGDLAIGDTGEASGLSEMAAELWFKSTAANMGSSQTMLAGPQLTSGFRQWYFTLNTTFIQFTARNHLGLIFTATNPFPILADTWYHIVGAVQGGEVKLYVNSVEVAHIPWSGVIDPTAPAGGGLGDLRVGGNAADFFFYDELAFYRYGLVAERVLAHYQAGVQRGFPLQLPGERIGAVLDTLGSTAPRNVKQGTRTVVESYMDGTSPLDEIRKAKGAEAVDAVFFVARDGTLTFLDASHRSSSPYNTVQLTFGDGGGSEVPYVDTNVDYSEDFLFNDWAVTRTTRQQVPSNPGTAKTASDTASINSYFKRSQSIGGVPVINDSDAQDIANAMLAKYKNPMLRGTSIILTTQDPIPAEQLFRRDIGDRIRLLRTPPGGGARIDQTLYIQQIQIQGANDGNPWTITWAVSPL